jgi:hypothetical protein
MRRFLALTIVAMLCAVAAGIVEAAQRRRAVRVGPYPTVDCTAAGPCREIAIAGDAAATIAGRPSPARGFADPSIRRDPALPVIWMAYSWPHTELLAGATVTTVDSHLARSDDSGVTWRFIRPLWRAERASDETGAAGLLNSETVTLAPDPTAPTGEWYSARFQYFTSGTPKVTSFTLRVAAAPSPELLASAEESVLGCAATHPYWQPDVDLTSLSRELQGCIWNDPALLMRERTLYLATQCMIFRAGEERPEDEFIALFGTTPAGRARTWTWRYIGKLAGREEAKELGGEMLQQTDLAVARDGALLAIASPARPSTPLATHFGCRAFEIASLDPPRLARDFAGRLRVRAAVTVTDQPPYGPGSCGYDAQSATGIVIARRQVQPELIVTLNASRLRP